MESSPINLAFFVGLYFLKIGIVQASLGYIVRPCLNKPRPRVLLSGGALV